MFLVVLSRHKECWRCLREGRILACFLKETHLHIIQLFLGVFEEKEIGKKWRQRNKKMRAVEPLVRLLVLQCSSKNRIICVNN